RLPFVLDREELRDEAVEVRRDRDQELRLGLRRERVGIRARGRPTRMERRVRLGEPGRERAIDARETGGVVEVLEEEIEGEAEEWFRNGHCGGACGENVDFIGFISRSRSAHRKGARLLSFS